MNFQEKWKKLNTQAKREEYERINLKYPNHIPVIVLSSPDLKLDKHKFLLKPEMSIGQFMYTLRKRIKLEEHEALFLFTNNKILPVSQLISVAYRDCKDKSGFIMFDLSKESTFG
jgi:GABA(A) receptor-associated protein